MAIIDKQIKLFGLVTVHIKIQGEKPNLEVPGQYRM